MRAAQWAADALARRAADGDRVNVFGCGTHLHVGHHGPDRPLRGTTVAPPPLTHTPAVPRQVLDRLGMIT